MKRYKCYCLADNKHNNKSRGLSIEVEADTPQEAARIACKEWQCEIVSVAEITTQPLENRSAVQLRFYNDFGTRMKRNPAKPNTFIRADGHPIHSRKEKSDT